MHVLVQSYDLFMDSVLPPVASTAFALTSQAVLLASAGTGASNGREIKDDNWMLQANKSSEVIGEGLIGVDRVTEVLNEE